MKSIKFLIIFVVVLLLSGCAIATPTATLTSTITLMSTEKATPTLTLTIIPTSTEIPSPTVTPTPNEIQLSPIELEKAVWSAPELTGGLEFFNENMSSQLYYDVIETFAVSPSLRNYWNNLGVTPTLEGVLYYLQKNDYFLPGKAGDEELKILMSTRVYWNDVSTYTTAPLKNGIFLDGIRVALGLPWNWEYTKNFISVPSSLRFANRNKRGASLAENYGTSNAVGFLVTGDQRILVIYIQAEDAKDHTVPVGGYQIIDPFTIKVSKKYPEKIPKIISGIILSYLDCFKRISDSEIYHFEIGIESDETTGQLHLIIYKHTKQVSFYSEVYFEFL